MGAFAHAAGREESRGGTHLHFFALKVSPRISQKNGNRPHGAGGIEFPGFTHLHRSPSNSSP
jgi:hypothetical protein